MVRFALLLWLLTLSLGNRARAQDLVEDTVDCEGPLTGDELRHPRANIAKRTLYDLAAVPASVVAWDAQDWTVFGTTALATGALMLPPKDSLDVRFQRWVENHERPGYDKALIKIGTIPEAVALAGYGALLFGTAYLTDNKKLFEFGSLSLEALAVSQFYHVVSKLLVGREAPQQGDGNGEVHGPTVFLFPGGTPSGHASTAYALLAVTTEYWDKWPLYVLGHAAALYISVSLVYSRQHFVSDVLWGGVMGYAIGHWVMAHRSSLRRCGTKPSTQSVWQRTVVFPVATGQGGALAASLRF